MKVTLRIYFRNIMLFVRRKEGGIDVWFIDGHKAHVVTADEVKNLTMKVVTICDRNGPLSGGPFRVKETELIVDFGNLHPRPFVHDDIKNGELSKLRKARVELRGSGTFRGLPSTHSHGGLLTWAIPKFDTGRPMGHHQQRMTELAMYEVADVESPVYLMVGQDSMEIPVHQDERRQSIAEAFFMAGELERVRTVDEEYTIDEFEDLSVCFRDDTAQDLKKSIPKTARPKGPVDAIRTADPFCPNAMVSL